jgi:putative phage-type endonuclease
MEQGSDDWFAARLGKATASRIADIVAKTKTGWGASRANYEAQLIAERLTETAAESYTNAAMQWGIDTEPQARRAYEFMADAEVEGVGFVEHPGLEWSGASPDGLVGENGLLEIKCPATATHIATLLGAAIPGKYIKQVQWQLACTGRQWCDWVSYDPRMPENMCLFVERIGRDDALITELEKEVRRFMDEVAGKVAKLIEQYGRTT